VARKVVWYEKPEETLADLITFLTHFDGLRILGGCISGRALCAQEEFEEYLSMLRPECFRRDVWKKWHERVFGMPVPPLPRRRFQMVSLGRRRDIFLLVGSARCGGTPKTGSCC